MNEFTAGVLTLVSSAAPSKISTLVSVPEPAWALMPMVTVPCARLALLAGVVIETVGGTKGACGVTLTLLDTDPMPMRLEAVMLQV